LSAAPTHSSCWDGSPAELDVTVRYAGAVTELNTPVVEQVPQVSADGLVIMFHSTRAGGLPPILTGYAGALDRDGIASGKISFAGFPEFRGLRFFSGFVVLDPAAPSGIRTISNAHEVLVQ
jgi:hypothetical protein